MEGKELLIRNSINNTQFFSHKCTAIQAQSPLKITPEIMHFQRMDAIEK